MEVSVRYGDGDGHMTQKTTWSSTVPSLEGGHLLYGDHVDVGDPDRGLWFHRLYAAAEDGGIYSFLPEDDPSGGAVCVADRADMDRALSVSVDGEPVLVRAAEGEEAPFECGLTWAVEELSLLDALGQAMAGEVEEGPAEEGPADGPGGL